MKNTKFLVADGGEVAGDEEGQVYSGPDLIAMGENYIENEEMYPIKLLGSDGRRYELAFTVEIVEVDADAWGIEDDNLPGYFKGWARKSK